MSLTSYQTAPPRGRCLALAPFGSAWALLAAAELGDDAARMSGAWSLLCLLRPMRGHGGRLFGSRRWEDVTGLEPLSFHSLFAIRFGEGCSRVDDELGLAGLAATDSPVP